MTTNVLFQIVVTLKSNFNAKRNLFNQAIDFKGRYSEIEPLGKTKTVYLRHKRVKVSRP
jgi:hypothetical protein